MAEGVCYGRSDLALGPDFEAAANAALAALPAVARVVTSPLGRCRRLAERVAAARSLPLAEDARLIEFDFGAWEGRRWTDLPRNELDAWAADFRNARPHGGESVAMLAARVEAALAEAPAGEPPLLWVTHAGVARAACGALGIAEGWDTRLDFGAWLDLRG
ncbi:histidine phosphatase family protein [uncultured Amaricoccus sp.]|uniref:histidine phosphatase family protein n=1 Tax=uncultured Amaricoccus sp. TaxID=339341 RepID=UPI00262E2ADA|nr:histidine phosphatase family protein [uncultured Amaricoccus sp.]